MANVNFLEDRISSYLASKELYFDPNADVLAKFHIEKAKHNLLVGRIMFELSTNDDYKKSIPIISKEFGCFDWVISTSYYSMFHASTAALAVLGMKARSHEALIHAIEYYLHHKREMLNAEDIKKLKNARVLEKKYVNSLWSAKTARNIAHYETGKKFSEKEARELIASATDFIERIEAFMDEMIKG